MVLGIGGNLMKRSGTESSLRLAGKLALLVAVVMGWCPLRGAQATKVGEIITAFSPLTKLVELLQQRYAAPVTLESPLWLWRGNQELLGVARDGREFLGQKQHSLILPEVLASRDDSEA
jgi:hypothetical protein